VVAYPLGLNGLRRQQRQAGQPAFAGSLKIAMRFQRPGVSRQLLHLVAMDQIPALWAFERSRRNLPRTARTFLRHFRSK